MSQSDRVPLPVTAPGLLALAHKFGRFLLVGVVCTALQYGLLILLVEVFRLQPTPASTIGYIASSVVNYLLNYSFTFRSSADHRRALPRFLLIALCGLALNAAITYVGTAVMGLQYLLAQVLATGATLVWNFLVNLRWTF